MNDVAFRVRIDDLEDLQAALDAAAQDDSLEATVVHPQRSDTDAHPQPSGTSPQIEPVAAILIGSGVIAAAKFVMDWWSRRRGGLVIDQRPDAPDMIYRDRDLEYGYVLVFPPDGGKVEVEVKDAPEDAAERWIRDVIAGILKSTPEVASAAEKAIDGGKVMTEQPATE